MLNNSFLDSNSMQLINQKQQQTIIYNLDLPTCMEALCLMILVLQEPRVLSQKPETAFCSTLRLPLI